MPILDLQKRARELGRIRTGNKGAKGQPQRLEKFRLTSASRALLERVAELYGGTVREWDNGGLTQFEVYTEATRLPILVPPQPVSQWYEAWTAAGCKHRCDGVNDMISGEPCRADDPLHVQAQSHPTTRLKVVLRDVEGLGVWRLESHGWNAAVELPDVAEFLSQGAGYVDGWLALEERRTKSIGADGQPLTRRFLVPVIEVDVTPAELLAGKGRISAPALGGPVKALGTGTDYAGLLEGATTADEVNGIWFQAKEAGELTQEVADLIAARAAQIKEAQPALEQGAQPDEDGVVDADVVDNPPPAPAAGDDTDALYSQCIAAAGDIGMTLWAMEEAFKEGAGVPITDASPTQLQGFLHHLTSQKENGS